MKTCLTAFLTVYILNHTLFPWLTGQLVCTLSNTPGGSDKYCSHYNMIAFNPGKSLSKTNDGLAREVWLAPSAYQSKEEMEMSPGKLALRFSLSLWTGVGPVQSLRQCAKLQKEDFQSPLSESQMCWHAVCHCVWDRQLPYFHQQIWEKTLKAHIWVLPCSLWGGRWAQFTLLTGVVAAICSIHNDIILHCNIYLLLWFLSSYRLGTPGYVFWFS